ncbi:hypothetical protein GCM10022227_02410 [Streptomyces sedi]
MGLVLRLPLGAGRVGLQPRARAGPHAVGVRPIRDQGETDVRRRLGNASVPVREEPMMAEFDTELDLDIDDTEEIGTQDNAAQCGNSYCAMCGGGSVQCG